MSKCIRRTHRAVPDSVVREVQQLETKQLLTGTVEVSFSKSGDIHVNGDRHDNDVTIEVNGNMATVTGNSGTQLKRGNQVVAPGVPVNVPLPSYIRDLRVHMMGGNDTVDVVVNSDVRIHRDIDVDTGAGDDFVSVVSNGGRILVGRNASVSTGLGNDTLNILDAQKFANVDTPAEIRAVANDTARAGNQAIRIGKNLDIRTGGGVDTVAVLGVEAGNDVEINTGLGYEDLVVVSNLRTGDDFTLLRSDLTALNNMTVVDQLRISTTGDNDRLVIEDIRTHRLEIDLGTGNDQLAIGTGVISTKPASINGGPGRDNITRSSPLPGATYRNFEGNSVNTGTILNDLFSELMDAGLI